MSPAELNRFIRDAARRLYDPSVPNDGSTPRTREEFADLCALMRAKVDALKQDATMPEPPEYDGPPSPEAFSPSDELEALYRWLNGELGTAINQRHGSLGRAARYFGM